VSDLIEHVRRSISQTIFHSPTAYSCFGVESPRLSPRITKAMTPRTARNYLLYQLQSHLYNDFYIRGGVNSTSWSDSADEADAVSFVESLTDANQGTGCRESGWIILTSVNGHISVRKGGLTLWLRPEEYTVPPGSSTEPGSSVILHMPKDLPGISPGYYMVLSNREDASRDAEPLVRLYWNLSSAGAAPFIRSATTILNDAGLFFRLKVLSDPRNYTRCDAAVVYFHKSSHPIVTRLLARIYADVAPYLKPRTPLFTKALAPGVGLAEDPGKDESFGQSRCRLLAEGMIRAYEQQAQSLHQRFDIVSDYYNSSGVSLTAPYLNPGSLDDYTFSPRES
jgi:HopA1 effector protein family